MSTIPRTEQEFNMLMEEIENILKNRNIPIYNRPIRAPLEVTKKLKISIPWLPIQGKASPDYTAKSLS